MKLHCTYCGKEFEANRKARKFCSQECYQSYVKKQADVSFRKQDTEDRVVITAKSSNGEFGLVILSDVHNNYEYLKDVVEKIEDDPSCRVIINGDLWDADQFSSHPTQSVVSLSDSIKEVTSILRPIFPQLLGFVWGNHEERCFRAPAGKGTMPSYFDLFFEQVRAINSEFQVALPMQSIILEVDMKEKMWRALIKHGKSSGVNLGILEFREIMATNEDIDVIVLSHIHIPMHIIVRRSTVSDPREVHWVRTTAGMAFCPYQDRMNLFISPMGVTKITFNNKLKVELV